MQKIEYLKNIKSSLDEIKSIFQNFWNVFFLVKYKIVNTSFKVDFINNFTWDGSNSVNSQHLLLTKQGCRKLMEPSRTFKASHHFKTVDLRIMNFWSFFYGHVAYCAKNITNLLFMLRLPWLLIFYDDIVSFWVIMLVLFLVFSSNTCWCKHFY